MIHICPFTPSLQVEVAQDNNNISCGTSSFHSVNSIQYNFYLNGKLISYKIELTLSLTLHVGP